MFSFFIISFFHNLENIHYFPATIMLCNLRINPNQRNIMYRVLRLTVRFFSKELAASVAYMFFGSCAML